MLEVDAVTGNVALEEASHTVHVEHGEYGYCTNFLLVGSGWDFDQVRERIAALGDSAVIVGDDRIVKVHIHTETPGTVLDYACSLGSLRQIGITNMQDQHDEFIEMHGAEESGGQAATPTASANVAQGRIAVLAVASGPGLASTFKSMGASAIIEGGQTMNPSTEDILKVVESVPQNEVIILPNNGNIIMSARQTIGLSRKQVSVVPTDTIPQGVSALLAMNYEASLDDNVKAMHEASKGVQTAELTRAVRDAKVNGIKVKSGQMIGLINNTLVTTGKERDVVAWDLLGRLNAEDSELITIYWGGEVDEAAAGAFHNQIQQRYPNAEVELVFGGQPFYDYIISAE
jgi:DAK2 domain fusion protein YloV